MDDLDRALLAALREDGRAALSALAARLGVTRTTVRTRMDRLERQGEIVGYTVLHKSDSAAHPVRALMMIGIQGRGAERILRQLARLPEVRATHTTSGRWDLIAEIGTGSLEELDHTLTRIRAIEGVDTSETSLLLSARKLSGAPLGR